MNASPHTVIEMAGGVGAPFQHPGVLTDLMAARTEPGQDGDLPFAIITFAAAAALLILVTGRQPVTRNLSVPEQRYLESRAGCPRPDAADAVDGDPNDEPGRRGVGAGREHGVRTDVGVREILE